MNVTVGILGPGGQRHSLARLSMGGPDRPRDCWGKFHNISMSLGYFWAGQ
jgi:hypothetical protein